MKIKIKYPDDMSVDDAIDLAGECITETPIPHSLAGSLMRSCDDAYWVLARYTKSGGISVTIQDADGGDYE